MIEFCKYNKPFINKNARFNNLPELGQEYKEFVDIDYDFDEIKIIRREEEKITFSDENNNFKYMFKKLFEQYPNASNILQLGFRKGFVSDQILTNINNKNKGIKKLTIVDEDVNVSDKEKIDTKHFYQSQLILGSVFNVHPELMIEYNMVVVSDFYDASETFYIVKQFRKYYDTQIVIVFLTSLDIIRYMCDKYNIFINDIIKTGKYFTVDMRFSKEEVEKFTRFDEFERQSIVYN